MSRIKHSRQFHPLALAISLAGVVIMALGCGSETSSPKNPNKTGEQAGVDETTGDPACLELDFCNLACHDDQCFQACAGKAGADATAKFKAYKDCYRDAQSNACKSECDTTHVGCQECINKACEAQEDACMGHGTQTCAQMKTCKAACASGDAACPNRCYHQGSGAAQALYDALDNCNTNAKYGTCTKECADSGSTACKTCRENFCTTAETACQ